MSWYESAYCKDDPNTDRWFSGRKQDQLDIQDICALCPVRPACGNAAMEEEKGQGADYRTGFRAYMTPGQRVTIERTGGLRGRDPMKVVMGLGTKRKDSHGQVRTMSVPAIPEGGVDWNRAHTALARKLTKWSEVNVKPGHYLPNDKKLCVMLKCSPERLHKVLDAMLQSGTIIEHTNGGRGSRYVRTSN